MALAPSITINLPGYPFNNLTSYATIALLRAASSSNLTSGQDVTVDAGVSAGDGLGGVYNWGDGSTANDDGYAVVKPNDRTNLQAGRWLLNSNLALAAFLQSGTGATSRTVQAKLRDTLNAADFLPANYVTNGTVDYTTQIQAAITQAIASNRELIFPAGKFKVTGTGLAGAPTSIQSLKMRGQGANATIIENTNGNVLRLQGTALSIRDMSFWATGGDAIVQTDILDQMVWDHAGIVQNSNGFSCWNNATFEFVENRFTNFFFQHTTASTVPAFKLIAATGLINDNVWARGRCQNSGTKHFFHVEGTGNTAAQYNNAWRDVNFEVCCGGGIRLISNINYVIDNCVNWDVALGPGGTCVNDFFSMEINANSVPCIGRISDVGRWGGAITGGKFDVKLPGSGGGGGTEILNCRTSGGSDPFRIDAQNNGCVVTTSGSNVVSVTNINGRMGFDSGTGHAVTAAGVKVLANQVIGPRDTGWTAMTGTGSKGALAAAAAGTASGSYAQAELQGALNRIAALEARLKSYDAALVTHGLIGA